MAGCAAPRKQAAPGEQQKTTQAQVERAQQMLADGRPLAAVRIYRDLAESAPPAEQQRWRLRIVELLFDSGYPELALEWHKKLDAQPIPEPLALRKRVVDAQAAVARQQGVRALRLLPPITEDMPEAFRARILRTQARAFEFTGQPERALSAWIQREHLLTSTTDVEDNHESIWSLLQGVPVDRLEQLARVEDMPILSGWANLALAVRRARLGEQSVQAVLERWRQQYRDHPAADKFVDKLRERVLAELRYPPKIALLLPLSGQLSDPASAIRDGLLAAYYDQPDYIPRPRITIYDTGSDGMDAGAAYDRAVADGAAFVIGPLQKSAVAELAGRMRLDVPVLSLNYLPDGSVRPPDNLYQFGLLPEDEARQAAEAAIQNDHFNAVALVPAGDWGSRMLDAFRSRFEELGGVVLESGQYNSRATDYARSIRAIMNLDRSYARERRVESTIGQSVSFEPRRRQDVQMIYIAAMPKQARLIKPQLDFHRAADLPTYASSHVFAGTVNPDADWDMNGLFFTDVPWVLDNLKAPDPLYRAIRQDWPGLQKRYPRLFALGIDAFALLPHLDRLRGDTTAGLTGRTGRLTLDDHHRIHRQLRWATFVQGVPKPVPRPEANPDDQAPVGTDIRERANDS